MKSEIFNRSLVISLKEKIRIKTSIVSLHFHVFMSIINEILDHQFHSKTVKWELIHLETTENSDDDITVDKICCLSREFGLSPTWLICGIGTMFDPKIKMHKYDENHSEDEVNHGMAV